jgi:hypothetical protein
VSRAESYPLDVPLWPYCFGGRHRQSPLARFSGQGRTPVIALGAIAAPSELARRFPEIEAPIPVTRAILRHFAVVYAWEFAGGGYLHATLQRHRGTASYLFLIWLSEDQLEHLHEVESVGAAVAYEVLQGVQIEDEQCGLVDQAGVYLRVAGPLVHRSLPIRLAEVPTTGCTLPALTQGATLRLAHRLLQPAEPYPEFVARIVHEPAYRAAVNRSLSRRQEPLPGSV